MSKSILENLIKLIQSDSIVDTLTEEEQVEIKNKVLNGYRIDEDSRNNWLEANQEAVKIIRHCEDDTNEDTLEAEVYKSAKVIYPLLSTAIIRLSARLNTLIKRNNKVVEIAAIGKDEQIPANPQQFMQYQMIMQQLQQNPQLMQQMQQAGKMPPQPEMIWKKASKAERVDNYMNYKLLIESDSWLQDTQKLNAILSGWGTAFRQVYYDEINNKIVNFLLPPEDVIINHNISNLEDAPRVTIKYYMTKNDIIEQMMIGKFTELTEEELDRLESFSDKKDSDGNVINDTFPSGIVYRQDVYLDLDEDGYAEPYKVWVHEDLDKILCIEPAFEFKDIKHNNKDIICIKRNLDIVDYHLIDDPEGKFYSLGLNYLLLHQNKAITALERELLDAGNLANAASCTGFVTNAFKTRERRLEFQFGEYKQIDVNPAVTNPQQHVINLPAKDPSQVLLALFETLIQSAEKTAMITDVLTGDIAGQNIPATTMLAMIHQATEPFVPIFEKFTIGRKKEFKMFFDLTYKHLNDKEYIYFQNMDVEVVKDDFSPRSLDIMPVGDPSESSAASKYAKLQFIIQMMGSGAIQALNMPACVTELFKGIGFDNPNQFVNTQPAPPDPRMMAVQANMQKNQIEAQKNQQQTQVEVLKQQNEQQKIENERLKTILNVHDIQHRHNIDSIHINNENMKAVHGMTLDEGKLHIENKFADIQQQQVNVDKQKANTEEARVRHELNRPKE